MKLRKEYLPYVVRNQSNLPDVEQEYLGKFNKFFCGLYFLVSFADQVEACLKVQENILYNGQNVDFLVHGGYSNDESGTLRLIRKVCKSARYQSCEKSGRMIIFEVFIEKQDICHLPLYQFLGNRLDIVFLNSAGIYYLYNQLNF